MKSANKTDFTEKGINCIIVRLKEGNGAREQI